MKNHVWEWTKKVLGVLLIVGGIIGLFLPFLQGVAMIVAGAVLLHNKWLLAKIRATIKYFKDWRRR